MCGGDAYSTHGICRVPLHFIPTKGKHIGKMCFFYYHDKYFFGLAQVDSKLLKTKKLEWAYTSVSKKKGNAKRLDNLE